MNYLIDGYNLLHVTNVFGDGSGPKSLSLLHTRFLDDLAGLLSPEECRRTTIVFDAKGRRATERRTAEYNGITVHYAARTEDADTMIAELVKEYNAPRNLTVVSSDHQVQRAAKRRRAKAVDSDVWYTEMRRRRRERQSAADSSTASPSSEGASEQDVNWWLAQFDAELLNELNADGSRIPPKSDETPKPTSESATRETPEHAALPIERKAEDERDEYLGLANPFPPEYIAEVAREIAGELAPPNPPPKADVRKKRSKKRD